MEYFKKQCKWRYILDDIVILFPQTVEIFFPKRQYNNFIIVETVKSQACFQNTTHRSIAIALTITCISYCDNLFNNYQVDYGKKNIHVMLQA